MVAASILKIPSLPIVAPYIAIKTVPFGKSFADELIKALEVIFSIVE